VAKRKKMTPDERREWERRGEEIQQQLQFHIKRVTAELAAKKRQA